MNQGNNNGLVRLIHSLISLFSMFIQSAVYTVILYILMSMTWLGIELESFGGTFIAVAAVTVLIPFMFLVDILVGILYEAVFHKLPITLVIGGKKVVELLILTCIINRVDAFASTMTLSLYGETIFAFIIYLIMEWFMRKTTKKNVNENTE